MRVKLVEITKSESGWKGTWYKRGQRHFVTPQPGYPGVYREKYRAIDVCGGINEGDCREVRGPRAWLQCAWKGMQELARKFFA
jgi:hypothetical protein